MALTDLGIKRDILPWNNEWNNEGNQTQDSQFGPHYPAFCKIFGLHVECGKRPDVANCKHEEGDEQYRDKMGVRDSSPPVA